MTGRIITIIAMIGLSGFLSASETALLSLERLRMRRIIRRGGRAGRLLIFWKDHPNEMISTILILNNLVNILASVLASAIAMELFPSAGIAIATGVMTFLIITFGEVTPKIYARANRERLASGALAVLIPCSKCLMPVVKFFTLLGMGLSRLIGGRAVSKQNLLISESDLRALFDEGAEEGVLAQDEKKMLGRVLTFSDTIVREVMIPRPDMECINIDEDREYFVQKVIGTGHSRLPVYRESVDNVIGTLYVKDILGALAKGGEVNIETLLREPYLVPETKKLSQLLREFRGGHQHMAIVIDEYGVTVGLVTLEDLLEEITGEIWDEYDLAEKTIERQQDGSHLISAKEDIHKINEELNLDMPAEEFDTLGGLALDFLGRLPKKGEEFTYRGLRFRIEDANRRRIIKIRLKKLDAT